MGPDQDTQEDVLIANGIDATSGTPLPPPTPASIERVASSFGVQTEHVVPELKSYGPVSEIDPQDLSQAGWAIVFAQDFDASGIKEALHPLIQKRQAEAKENFRIFEGEQGVRRGDTVSRWLKRQGKGPGLSQVDPKTGVPYYILLVGSPSDIPNSFQYTLDIFWAVGRLHFDDIKDYEAYARAVVDYENRAEAFGKRKLSIFAPVHEFDRATAMFGRDIVGAIEGDQTETRLGRRQQFELNFIKGEFATKGALSQLLGSEKDRPQILFTGSHGLSIDVGDPRQADLQGALICQDWKPFRPVEGADCFAAEDLPSDARLDGLMHILFACYGAGWEEFDTFRDGPNGEAKRISQKPELAKLPKKILACGALCVIGHIDRAWSYSFRTLENKSNRGPLVSIIKGLMNGTRVGHATDGFNLQWAAISTLIADAQRDFVGAEMKDALAKLWIARDDARNYIVMGDPAVRLSVNLLRRGT